MILAFGFKPYSSTFSLFIISTTEAASFLPLAFPGVTVPFSLNTAGSVASFSGEVRKKTVTFDTDDHLFLTSPDQLTTSRQEVSPVSLDTLGMDAHLYQT